MKKYLIYTDVHWSQYSSILRKRGSKYSTRLEGLINTMNWVQKLAIDTNCDEIFSLGDFFDRSDMNAEEITALKDISWANVPQKFIVGNHESNIGTLNYSTTEIFSNINADVISEVKKESVTDNVDFYFIPYMTSENKVINVSDFLEKDSKKKIVFAHADIAGLRYGKFVSQSGFDADDIINNCSLFINGHLHNGMIIRDKIILVGNTSGQNFNENSFDYDHLAYILTINDDDSITLDSYENPYAFNFYKIKIEKDEDIKQLDKLKQNSVLSIICNSNLIQKVENKIRSMSNIIEHRIVVMYSLSHNGEINTDCFKIEDHVKQFIEFAQNKLEQSDVLQDELARLGGGN